MSIFVSVFSHFSPQTNPTLGLILKKYEVDLPSNINLNSRSNFYYQKKRMTEDQKKGCIDRAKEQTG
jgi:hypothetical protein